MRTIWRYPIDLTALDLSESFAAIRVPCISRFLSAHVQHGRICVWADVDDGEMKVPCRIYVVGTGQPSPVPESAQFIGTVMLANDNLVLHLWSYYP
jgi:hypothetical protein